MSGGKILSEYDIGYLSGIIDGEGWVGFSHEKPYKKFTQFTSWSPRIEIAMTDEKTIKYVSKLIGTKYYDAFKNYINSQKTKMKCRQWRCGLYGKNLRALSPQLRLINKEEELKRVYEASCLQEWGREFNFAVSKEGEKIFPRICQRIQQLVDIDRVQESMWGGEQL